MTQHFRALPRSATSGMPSSAGLLLAPALAVTLLLFGGALVGAIRTSLQPAGVGGGASLDAWRAVLNDPAFADALGFSFQVTVASTAVSAAVALALAALLRHRGDVPRALFALAVALPHLIVAVLAVVWLGAGGLADRLMGELPVVLIRDRAGLGVVGVYVYKEAPFLVLLLLAAWNRSVAGREEAAAVLGANRWQRLRWVVWPAIRRPLVIGSVIVGAFVFGAFEVPLVVGPTYPPTVATFALEQTQSAALVGQARAAAALLVAAAVTMLLALLGGREIGAADG